MQNSTKGLLSVAFFMSLIAGIALADYYQNGNRVIDNNNSNKSTSFIVNNGGTLKTPLTVDGTTASAYVSSGYGANLGPNNLTLGANGSSPHSASMTWGDGTGYHLDAGHNNAGTYSFVFDDRGWMQGAPAGVGTPTYGFTSTAGTGVYSSGSSTIDFAGGGNHIGQISPFGLQVQDGSVGQNGLAFIQQPNTGFSRIVASDISAVTNGTETARFVPTGLESGRINADSAIKWRVFIGTMTTSSSDLVAPSGVILGAIGVVTNGTIPVPLASLPSSGVCNTPTFSACLIPGSVGNSVAIFSNIAGTVTYRVIVYYQ